jgi:competence ComEA-like helix-hairpin-helix protein
LAEVTAALLVVFLLALLAWWWNRPTPPLEEPFSCQRPVEIITHEGAALWCDTNDLEALLGRFGGAACAPAVRDLAAANPPPLRLWLAPDCTPERLTDVLSPTVLQALGQPLDLNRALAEDLEVLTGIGPALAAAIVLERSAEGPFCSVAELARVKGIGPGRIQAIEAQAIGLLARCER